MQAYELLYSILMSVPFHENPLLGFWIEDWIIHEFEKHEMSWWFL